MLLLFFPAAHQREKPSFLGFNLQDESLFMTSLLLVNAQGHLLAAVNHILHALPRGILRNKGS